ncbi:MAG: endopeptidase La [Candidatus Amoebophilus sp. 36-38]|nr:MAG: endopeptidase La [Candidatus Amoebophilus sp. 36-38]
MISPGITTERSETLSHLLESGKKNMHDVDNKDTPLPIIFSKHNVLFPGIYMPMTLEKASIIKLVKKVHESEGVLGVVAQKKENIEVVGIQDIFHVGTTAHILKLINLPDGRVRVLLQGEEKFQIEEIMSETPYLLAHVGKLKDKLINGDSKHFKAVVRSIKETVAKFISLQPEFPTEVRLILDNINDFNFLTYFLASGLDTDIKNKQKLLEIDNSKQRGTVLLKYLLKDLEISKLRKKIQDKVHTDIEQIQQDFYIRRQIKALQEELGENEFEDEIEELRAKGEKKQWSKEIANYFYKTLDRAERLSPNSSDYPVLINHAELLLELPWNIYTADNMDLKTAEKILNAEHYGIEKVKERLLEYLAVRKLKKNMKGPILCLYGPPGVGKTSLGKSIAKALNRKYVKVSLGGLHDEAEIRGHRKTYVGAMPGRIIKGFQTSGSSNPVFVLDELDKITELRGDPAAALLEVLDPEQNHAFVDNFLEVPYDLSKSLFIATANQLDTIPPALRDRLEIIEITGYTLEEKLQIAKKYLFPKQRKENGLKATDIAIHDTAILKVIENYTRESGVRELERKLASLARKVGKAMVLGEPYPKKINKEDVAKLLGIEEFDQEIYQQTHLPGVAIGLAWTPVGGDILFIEAILSRGKGKLTLSGQLGDVMRESAMTALTYLKANAESLSIAVEVFENYDLHIHVPAGAIPKDGPSAGITLFTALASLYTQRKIKDKVAMTGEITLRGKVLPVGGIKEKVLAAKRAGIKEIILSAENRKDVQEIKQKDIQDISFHYVEFIEEVIQQALQPHQIKHAKNWDISKKRAKKSL